MNNNTVTEDWGRGFPCIVDVFAGTRIIGRGRRILRMGRELGSGRGAALS